MYRHSNVGMHNNCIKIDHLLALEKLSERVISACALPYLAVLILHHFLDFNAQFERLI